jgi:fluoride exporter
MTGTGLLLVAVGGALGATCRYWVGLMWARGESECSTPTLFVNVTGSLLLGILFGLLEPDLTEAVQEPLLVFSAVGFCAAYTTFSSFCTEWVALMRGSKRRALRYLVLTILGCLLGFGVPFFLLSA